MQRTKAASVPAYISGFPAGTKKLLKEIRDLIRKTVPEAEECISYDIPSYKWNGRQLIYFAAFKNHVSVYPAPRGAAAFSKELAVYKGGKGTVQFSLDESLPLDLIKRIIQFRMKDILEKKAAKKLAQ